MRRSSFALIAAGVVLVGHGAFESRTSAAPPLSAADATRLRAVIAPRAGEDPFDTIPWEIGLWAARAKAAAAGKPVLLWEMDGHPLGCG